MISQPDCRKPEGSGPTNAWRSLATGLTVLAVTGGAFAVQAAPTNNALTLGQHATSKTITTIPSTWRPKFLAKPPVVNGALRAQSRNVRARVENT